MKERFLKVFANLPIPERSNTIYVSTEHGPMSWHVVKLEVEADTKIGEAALDFLSRLKII